MPFSYNPHQHVKIWLSKNPDLFMNLENRERIIEIRQKNKNDKISFVYDSSLLNEKAINSLNQFAKDNNLDLVDADKFDQSQLSENEKKLYEFYKDEITHLKEGGNLAVASDILRWMSPIFKCGTYTDLDVPIDTSSLPASIEVDAPIVVNMGSFRVNGKDLVLSFNDYIAIVDPVAGKEKIEQVQAGMLQKLQRYDNDYLEKSRKAFESDNSISKLILSQMQNRPETQYLQKAKDLNAKLKLTSRKLRQYVQEIMSDATKYLDFRRQPNETDAEVIKRLRAELEGDLNTVKWIFFNHEYNTIRNILKNNDKEFLRQLMKRELSYYLMQIIICTTGPFEVCNGLFKEYVFDSKTFDKDIQHYSLKKYDQYKLDQAFRSYDLFKLRENLWSMIQFGGTDTSTLSDCSWLPFGINAQAAREADILDRKCQLKELSLADFKTGQDIRDALEERIKKLKEVKHKDFNLESAFIPAIKNLQDELQKVPDDKLCSSTGAQLAVKTINLMDQVSALLQEPHEDEGVRKCRILKRLRNYDQECHHLTRSSVWSKIALGILAAGVGLVLGWPISFAVGASLGALMLPVTYASQQLFFKPSPMQQLTHQIGSASVTASP